MDARQRRGGFAGWWAKWAGTLAFATLITVGSIGFARTEEIASDAHDAAADAEAAVVGAEAEREARTNAVSGIIRLFCATDNRQDELLSSLVGVSLRSRPPRAQLTPEQLRGLRIFKAAQRDLKRPLRCQILVVKFLAGEPVPAAATERSGDRADERTKP